MTPARRKAYYILHLCVFIWGFTAILGNLISLQETILVWYRMGITAVSLLVLPDLWRGLKHFKFKELAKIAGVGVIVSFHWITFYGAIKYANVSVALTCLATISLFTAFIEPLFFKTKINKKEVLMGLAIVPAMYLIFYFNGQYITGLILGILSALFACLFSVINKKLVTQHEPLSLTFLELTTGFVFLTIMMPFYLQLFPGSNWIPTDLDIVYLLILSIGCTAIPFTLSLRSLRHLSAFTSNMTINMEPIYGILLAMLFFEEHKQLNIGFYVGAIIIIIIVFVNAWLHGLTNKSLEESH